MLQRIALTGPESSGKTTLAHQLAAALGGEVVPEFARAYLGALPDPAAYELADLEAMARGQLDAEAAAAARQPQGLLVCDTDLLVIMVWAEVRFGGCPAWLREVALAAGAYDLRLLVRPDLPWAPDPLREHPDPAARWRLFEHYRAALVGAGLPFREVGGVGAARLRHALESVRAGLGRPTG